MTGPSDEVNLATYRDEAVVGWYGAKEGLQPVETVVLGSLEDALRGARVLDLGVGAGRTTPYLSGLAASYVGIDYSQPLVTEARRRHPGVDIRHGDARYLAEVEKGSLDAVVFSFNGIDYIDHLGRLRALAEIRRALVPGGLFVFSSHNLHHRGVGRALPRSGGRLGRPYLRRLGHGIRHLPTHWRMRRHEVWADDHAIVNDEAHDFSLLTYYIGVPQQVTQLEGAGFTVDAVWSLAGERISPSQPDRDSIWVHYVARRSEP